MSKRILVIEDQEDNRRIMRDLLTSVGYEIIEALTGEDGVTAAASHVPDRSSRPARLQTWRRAAFPRT